MKPWNKVPVKVVGSSGRINGGVCEIKPNNGSFDLFVGEELIATCEYSKKLSSWAFNNGAFTVHHNYDLKLAELEP